QREDMPELLREADIAVLPTYYPEGLPKFLLEAAASGLPLVATDVPGCGDIVRHGVNGLIVPPRDPHALASAVAKLAADESLRTRFGQNSREIASKEFSIVAVTAEYAELYRLLRAQLQSEA